MLLLADYHSWAVVVHLLFLNKVLSVSGRWSVNV